MPTGYPKNGKRAKQSPLNRCTVCKHPERKRIEMLRLAGQSLDKLAERFSVSRDAIHRHMENHVTDYDKAGYFAGPAKIAALADVAAEESESLIDYLRILRSTLFGILDKAAEKNDPNSVSVVSGRLIEVLREIGKITGQVNEFAGSTIVNVQNNTLILNSAPMADLQAGLLEVCARHPDARGEIVALFRRLDQKYQQTAVPTSQAPSRLLEAANG